MRNLDEAVAREAIYTNPNQGTEQVWKRSSSYWLLFPSVAYSNPLFLRINFFFIGAKKNSFENGHFSFLDFFSPSRRLLIITRTVY